MGNFTPEQVEIAAKLCEHDGTGSALMLRAYAATLRQQAGRVGPKWDAIDAQIKAIAPEDFHIVPASEYAALAAALAQNTQGEAEGAAEIYDALPHCSEWTTFTFSRDKLQALLRHAERARVPVGIEAAIAHIQQKAEAYAEEHCGVEWDTGATTYHHGQAGEEYHHGLLELVDELQAIAAAPPPPTGQESGEVGHG